ncbi:hypothetical protein SISSUDRAFT_1066601 [Sistotremastrum suecicum HHB10207 ss-3]|uniref:DASH complex subunit DAD2 n=1 Tax=Sistotremastrum suecicum HHB10207 ss-3 TaxID=1314776 RepID=A0A165Y450_9AGAM|nr:hypothetical protein SISSUDRAFT_1066601 [Sistotremastrum suecicum HHB10207 ss-3]
MATHRQSHAFPRASHAPSAGGQSSNARYLEKKREVEGVMALEQATEDLLRRLEGMSDDIEVMAQAAAVHGSVMAHWSHVFRLAGLFLDRSQAAHGVATSEADLPTGEEETGQQLIRISIDALQQTTQDS